MRVDIDRTGAYTVSITGGFTGPYLNLDLSPAVAYELLLALDKKREELRDLANNYHECPDCGNTHPKAMRRCPLREEDEGE